MLRCLCRASKYPLPLRLSNPGGLAAPAPAGANSDAGTSEERYLAISAAVWVSVTIVSHKATLQTALRELERARKTACIACLLCPAQLVGIPASLLYLHLFRKWPLQMTKATVYGVMALLVVFTLITLVLAFPSKRNMPLKTLRRADSASLFGPHVCASVRGLCVCVCVCAVGIIMVIVCLFMAFMVWRVRPQLPLCAELLGVASRALMENLRVIPTTIAVSLVTLG